MLLRTWAARAGRGEVEAAIHTKRVGVDASTLPRSPRVPDPDLSSQRLDHQSSQTGRDVQEPALAAESKRHTQPPLPPVRADTEAGPRKQHTSSQQSGHLAAILPLDLFNSILFLDN